MIRVGVVGLGVIAGYYLTAIDALPDYELVAVCDVDRDVLAGHGVRDYLHHRAMLADGDLDAVVVTAPNDVHAAVARDVLDAGLPVCVEQPLATTLADGEDLARRPGVLFTAFHRRYNSNVVALRGELVNAAPIESLAVRHLERIEDRVGLGRRHLDAGRDGGGCVAANGPDALDLARLFVGPLTLESVKIVRDSTGVDRQALLRVRGSAPASIELDWSFPGETEEVEVRLADGTVLRADVLDGHRESEGSLRHEYVGVLRDFARAIRAGGREDGGLAALSLVDEARRREGA
ncbi:putative dehydrogenase [Saccharothrix tamanrassetensis]|uniref:Putative dehydrogenase n=1 Tax=Saccharothrix tamanrassetensis TaxID=1051531 RepID=A0A841CLV7_9PSEU|nr:Gfo/Idh/MocA family oxidoreductase [Saccharothrix tamanrassetensis]MBB5958090.1 putative dehydrogenase [Saccharothrix tamanrassetensis]